MATFDALAYYEGHYGGTTVDDWTRWHRDGHWPPKARLQPASTFPIEDGHGVVYHMLLPYGPFKRTLDMGCSAGDFILPLKSLSNESFGVDIAEFPGALKVMREHYDIHCQTYDLDKGDLPFPAGHFSAVTMIMALEHVFNVTHAAAEIARVLEPGGVAVIQVTNLAYIKRRIDLALGRLPITADHADKDFDKSWDGQHLHNFTLAALRKLFCKQNLSIESCRCFGRFAKLRSLWPSLLGADLTVLVKKPK